MNPIMKKMSIVTAASLPIGAAAKESDPSMPWWGFILLFVAMGFILSIRPLAQAIDADALERESRASQEEAVYQKM